MNAMLHMKTLLIPATTQGCRFTALGVFLLLAVSLSCVLVAPLAMPDSYSWFSNVISESAAQRVHSAWIARLGFLLFGLAVLWLTVSLKPVWARGDYWMHMAFSVFMVGTAAFSHRPWLDNIPFDSFEDLLHSITATGMGFAFSLGIVVRLLQREKGEGPKRAFDAFALVAATTLPLLGVVLPSMGGLFQRTMFIVAYLWYAHEALLVRKLASAAPNPSLQRTASGVR
jgi:hypothetical protein